jgi:hypothetical protein
MLDERYHSVGHELSGAHWRSTPRGFGDGDHASSSGNLNTPTSSGGSHLVGPHVVAGFDDDLYPITLHADL